MDLKMFADSVRIFIKSGKGGDGHVSFRRLTVVLTVAMADAEATLYS